MYIYNVTVNVEASILSQWETWMREQHIADVLATGLFSKCILHRVMVDEEQGVTFAVQYSAKDLQSIKLYQEMYAPELKQQTAQKFGDKCVAFRTILQEVQSFEP